MSVIESPLGLFVFKAIRVKVEMCRDIVDAVGGATVMTALTDSGIVRRNNSILVVLGSKRELKST